MNTSLPRGVPRCHHVKVNGTRCDSPALKGNAYCYFHYRNRTSASSPLPVLPGPNSQPLTAGFPSDQPLTTDDPSPTNRPSPPLPPPDLFLLEDANSIHCALQWVLRHILAATIDRRQASLLLYGLQIAAANIKHTHFEPYYDDIIRSLPAESSAAVPAAVAAGVSPAAVAPSTAASEQPLETSAPARAGRPRDSRQDAGATHNGPASPETDKQPALSLPPVAPTTEEPPSPAPPQLSLPAQLATDTCQLATAPPDSPQMPAEPRPPATAAQRPPKRPARRPPTAPLTTDHRPLTTPRPALSLMFQREVRRHFARLNSPASPSDLET